MKNHLGSYECKLCLTLHNNEVSRYCFSKKYFLRAQMKPMYVEMLKKHALLVKETGLGNVKSLIFYPKRNKKCIRVDLRRMLNVV